jgi:hypothetical protein
VTEDKKEITGKVTTALKQPSWLEPYVPDGHRNPLFILARDFSWFEALECFVENFDELSGSSKTFSKALSVNFE